MRVHKGKIVVLRGTRRSGLAELCIEDERRGRVNVLCENAPTVRALDGAFGDVIGEGHTFRNEALAGKEIYYSIGALGILEAFTPVGQADPELVEAYEKREE